MKQTAVEWLEDILWSGKDFDLNEVFKQAKEMEKEQIIDFGEEVIDHLCYGAQPRSWVEEKYYETFKSQEDDKV
jgi:hypothetical protein